MLNVIFYATGLLAASLLLFGPLGAQAQAPTWQSATTIGASATNPVQLWASVPDAAGNVYLSGAFSGTASFGTFTLTSAGDYDGFVAKLNPATNTFLWARRIGGAGVDNVTALAISGSSVYLTGFVSGTADLGGLSLPGAAGNGFDVFVAKLADTGPAPSFTWAQRLEGTDQEFTSSLVVQGSSLYVAGSFESPTLRLGSLSLTNTSAGYTDMFVTKLIDAGSSGSFAWARSGGGSLFDAASALAVQANSVYVTGSYTGTTATFGGTTLNNSAASGNTSDVFITKLTDAGLSADFTWTRSAGGGDWNDNPSSLAVSGTNVYVAGSYIGTPSFGSLTPGPSRTIDGFVAKLTDGGAGATFTWVAPLGGDWEDGAQSLVAVGNTVYVAGYYDGFTAGTATFGPLSLPNVGSRDIFVTRLTDMGPAPRFDWAQRAGGTDRNSTSMMSVANDKLYLAAYTAWPATFGGITLTGAAGASGSVLAILSDNVGTATTAAAAPRPLTCYPNPARTTVQVPAASAATVLTLTDGLGRMVRTAGGAQLSVAGLAPGLYVLQATTPGQPVRTGKLLVE